MRAATPVSSNGSEKMEERQIIGGQCSKQQENINWSISDQIPYITSFETAMTTGGHHVVRGNEWKVPSPEMMTYMSYEIYTYPYIHSHTMCIQCTVHMKTNTHTVTHPHTHTHTYMYAQYIQLYTRYTTSGCLTQTPYASWTRDQAESKDKSSLDLTQVSSGSAS